MDPITYRLNLNELDSNHATYAWIDTSGKALDVTLILPRRTFMEMDNPGSLTLTLTEGN